MRFVGKRAWFKLHFRRGLDRESLWVGNMQLWEEAKAALTVGRRPKADGGIVAVGRLG